MKKTITRVVAAIAVVAVSGISATWYVASGKLVEATTEHLTALGKKPLANGMAIAVTYDAIDRSGFPYAGVKITNPTYSLTLPAKAGEVPEKLVTKTTGTTTLVTNILANEYRLSSAGSSVISGTLGGQPIALSTSNGGSVTRIRAIDRKSFDAWGALDMSDGKAIAAQLKNIAEFSVHIDKGSVSAGADNARLATYDGAEITFVKRPVRHHTDVDVGMTVTNVETTKAYAQLIDQLMMQAATAQGRAATPLSLEDMPFAGARAGKQNFVFAANVNLPDAQGPGGFSNGTVKVKALTLANDYYTIKLPLEVVMKDGKDQRSATLRTDWLLDVKPASAKEIERMVDLVAKYSPQSFVGKPGEPVVDIAAVKAKIMPAVPTLSTLGPITLALDVDALLPNVAAPMDTANPEAPAAKTTGDTAKQSITLRRFEFSHKRWGLDASGKATGSDANGAIDGTIHCRQCAVLTRDAFDYARNLETVLASFGQPAGLSVSEAQLAALDKTLNEIGRKGSNGDIAFAITTPKPGDVRVNDKPIAEAMMKFMMLGAAAPVEPVAGETLPRVDAPSAVESGAAPKSE